MATKRKNKMVNMEFTPKLSGQLDFKPREFNFSEKQQKILDCLLNEDTKVVFLTGCSGSSKTFLAVYAALHLLNQDHGKNIVYIRTLVESASRSLGYLPGSESEKFQPFMLPLMEKCEEILEDHCSKQLFNSDKITAIPVNFLRGSSLKNKIVILDEFQNATLRENITSLSRIGEGTKYFVLADYAQSDINGKSGIKEIVNVFDNPESQEKGIYHFSFGKEDIVRSEILKFIMSKLESIPQK